MEILKEVYEGVVSSTEVVKDILSPDEDSPRAIPTSDPSTASKSNTDPQREISSLHRQVSADKDLDSVAGLEQAKQLLREAVVLPMRYRHLFTGK